MKECYIDFPKEVCAGAIGSEEEVKAYLKGLHGQYNYEGIQRVRNRDLHKWEKVAVYSVPDYFFGTGFVCYKVEERA